LAISTLTPAGRGEGTRLTIGFVAVPVIVQFVPPDTLWTPVADALIVGSVAEPERDIPVPAVILFTPVFLIVIAPVVEVTANPPFVVRLSTPVFPIVIAPVLPLTDIPLPADKEDTPLDPAVELIVGFVDVPVIVMFVPAVIVWTPVLPPLVICDSRLFSSNGTDHVFAPELGAVIY
jgi:hypothetical protein